MSVIKGCKASFSQQIDDYLDSEYHRQVPLFLESLNVAETNDFCAWNMGLIPVKAHAFQIRYLT